MVLGTRYGTWWPLYGRFEVGWLPLQLWLSAGVSSVAQCWFYEIEISAMYSYIPLDLNQLLDVGVDLWFQICIVDTHQRIYVMVKSLLRQLVSSFISVYATMAWYAAETNMCAFVIQQPKEVHDMANKRVISVFTLNRLQAGHWVRVNLVALVAVKYENASLRLWVFLFSIPVDYWKQ